MFECVCVLNVFVCEFAQNEGFYKVFSSQRSACQGEEAEFNSAQLLLMTATVSVIIVPFHGCPDEIREPD